MHEQQVVHPAMRFLKGELTDGDPSSSGKVQTGLALNHPPRSRKLPIDFFSGPRLSRYVVMVTRCHDADISGTHPNAVPPGPISGGRPGRRGGGQPVAEGRCDIRYPPVSRRARRQGFGSEAGRAGPVRS